MLIFVKKCIKSQGKGEHARRFEPGISSPGDQPHCVLLYLIPFEEDASDFLIFWSTHMSQIGERKKIEILRWPSEIAC